MNKILLNLVTEMAKADQDLRLKTKPGKNLGNFLIYCVDAIHNYRIKEILKKYGYPSQKLIGEEGMRSFWLLIQHQDFDIDLQEKCLKHCDFEPRNKAYLTDRILVNKGEKQKFGTQFIFSPEKNKFIPKPIADLKNINALRTEYGLITLENEEENINKNCSKNLKSLIKKSLQKDSGK